MFIDRARLLFVERIGNRRLDWFVVRWQRPVHQARRHEEPTEAIRPHDERRGSGKRIHARRARFRFVVGRFGRDVIRHIVACPFLRLRVPPHPLLFFAPGLPFGIGGGAVVHDAAVSRPGPTPLQLRAGLARRIGRAPIGEIFSRSGVDARIDPRSARRRAIVFQLGKAHAVPAGIFGEKAVDLL